MKTPFVRLRQPLPPAMLSHSGGRFYCPEWLDKIEKKIEKALNDFDTLFGFNLKLFNFKATENHEVETIMII